MLKEIKELVQVYNENSDNKMTIKMVNEYLTLYIDGQEITSGEIEVYQRVKGINREHGYELFELE